MSVSNFDLFKIAWRTSFVRLFYNYKCLFGQGICYCLKPLLLKNNQQSEQCKLDVLKQHSSFFNCNEYLAGLAAGIILKQEEDDPAKTAKVKQVITSPLGAIGDRLFYQLVIPSMLLLTVNLAFLFDFKAERGFFIAVLALVFGFNLLITLFRFGGVFWGYRMGTSSLKLFKHPLYQKIDVFLVYVLIFLQGMTCANLIVWFIRKFV